MKNRKKLIIAWQRLVSAGTTCPRCGSTESAVEEAVATLTQALTPLGMTVVLEKGELSPEAFARAPLQSNLITLNGQPLEAWLGASSGQSRSSSRRWPLTKPATSPARRSSLMSGCRRITPVAVQGASTRMRSKGRPSHQSGAAVRSAATSRAWRAVRPRLARTISSRWASMSIRSR